MTHLLTIIFAFTSLLASALAQSTPVNTSREYNLRTCLKPGQAGKQRFDNLYIYSYHTGAGLGDATFDKYTNDTAKGYLTPITNGNTSIQNFDLGTTFPWTMVMVPNEVFYTAWQPVRINAGGGSASDVGEAGFFINATGLQWTSSPGNPVSDEFGGWLVCNWWHETPQLFFRISYYNYPKKFTPCSCADVYLIPEYL